MPCLRVRQPPFVAPPEGRCPTRPYRRLPKWLPLVWPVLLATFLLPTGDAAESRSSTAADFWSFRPIHPPLPPAFADSDAGWLRTDVDRFILAGLRLRDLRPAPPAHRRDLLRRAAFDLTGLPPSAEEIDDFANDPDPHAFERRVERLLESPRYGERWGRWWLDVARYADTNGQDENKVLANAWRYRDWVIRSFNANQPFDQFAVYQLAGDLLPPTNDEREAADRLIATGFLVLGPKMLAEQDKPKLVMDVVDEQIDTVGRAFLGLTLGCARCHDHKFDPVPIADYYALAGVFKSTRTMENLDFVSKPNERQVATSAEITAHRTHLERLAAITNRIVSATRDADAALLDSRLRALPRLVRRALDPSDAPPAEPNGDTNAIHRLREILSPSSNFGADRDDLLRVAQDTNRLLRLVDYRPPNAPTGDRAEIRLGPGRVGGGFRARGTDSLELPSTASLEPATWTLEVWLRTSDFGARKGEPRRWLLGKNANEWDDGHFALVLDGRKPGAYLNIGGGRDHVHAVWSKDARIETNRWHHVAATYDGENLRLFVDGSPAGSAAVPGPRSRGKGPLALARRADGHVFFEGDLDEARLFDRALSADEIRQHFEQPGHAPTLVPVAAWEFNDLSAEQRDQVAVVRVRDALLGPGGALSLPPERRPLYPEATREALMALEKERDALLASAPPPPPVALAVGDAQPADLPVHQRGNHLQLGPRPVPRGFLQVVSRVHAPPPIPKDRSGRLELAQWLVSPGHPLVARVVVNRIWQAHFSEGLVRTPDNFGLRGERPTHPELLDWLAHRFVQSGWDVKALHRLILSSAVYQQSTMPAPAEPGSPGPEVVDPENRLLHRFPRRRLDAEMIRDAILQVSGRLDTTLGGSLVDWKNNEYVPGDEVSATSVRRTVYLPIVRDRTYDALLLFDFANPSVTTARRVPTVVPQQALFFLNSPLVQTSAVAVARSLPLGDDKAGPIPEQAIDAAYRRILGRTPSAPERERCRSFIRDYASHPGATPGEEGTASDAWAAFCQALMASNEFVYRP